MDKLLELGLNEEDLKDIIDIDEDISSLEDNEISEKIKILQNINCDDKEIRNIIISNPEYLTNITEEILNVISKLKELNIENLNIVFDSNPWLLNISVDEINDALKDKDLTKLSQSEIIELII